MNCVPAAAGIHKEQTLFIITGRKGHVVGFYLIILNTRNKYFSAVLFKKSLSYNDDFRTIRGGIESSDTDWNIRSEGGNRLVY